jgi:hypothetical protein
MSDVHVVVQGDPQESLPAAEAGGRLLLREQGSFPSRWVLEVEVVLVVVCVSEPPDLSLCGLLLHNVCSQNGSAQQAG